MLIDPIITTVPQSVDETGTVNQKITFKKGKAYFSVKFGSIKLLELLFVEIP